MRIVCTCVCTALQYINTTLNKMFVGQKRRSDCRTYVVRQKSSAALKKYADDLKRKCLLDGHDCV